MAGANVTLYATDPSAYLPADQTVLPLGSGTTDADGVATLKVFWFPGIPMGPGNCGGIWHERLANQHCQLSGRTPLHILACAMSSFAVVSVSPRESSSTDSKWRCCEEHLNCRLSFGRQW